MICFFVFLWMIKKLSERYQYSYSIFTQNILWYFLSVFIFSRVFYIIANWTELKYIQNPFEFFFMNDFDFSLIWGIIWFFAFLTLQLKVRKEKLEQYIDGIAISFLLVLALGYLWALLGWQVYGKETHFWIEILYTHSFTPIPYQVAIFPLPIVYSITFFILFCISYSLSLFVHLRSLLWYLSFISIASVLLIFEFFSGKYDIFSQTLWINMTQIFSVIAIVIFTYKLFQAYRSGEIKENTIILK